MHWWARSLSLDVSDHFPLDHSTGSPGTGLSKVACPAPSPIFHWTLTNVCNGLVTRKLLLNWLKWYNMLCRFVLLSWQVFLASNLNLILLVLKMFWNLLYNFSVSIPSYGWNLCSPLGTVDNGPKVPICHQTTCCAIETTDPKAYCLI